MFVFKKIVASFLLPPGFFILISVGLGCGCLFRKKVRNGIVWILFGCVMWLVSINLVSDLLLRGLEKGVVMPSQCQGDVLILLGGGTYDQVPDLTGAGTPSPESLARLVTAQRLYQRLRIPIIVSGGKAYGEVHSESQISRRFLMDLAVLPEHILIEDQSRDTFENAVFCARICQKYNYKRPILVTSALHMKRALLNFQKAGLDVIPFPAGYKTWPHRTYGWKDFLPNKIEDVRIALKEYLGLIYTRLIF